MVVTPEPSAVSLIELFEALVISSCMFRSPAQFIEFYRLMLEPRTKSGWSYSCSREVVAAENVCI